MFTTRRSLERRANRQQREGIEAFFETTSLLMNRGAIPDDVFTHDLIAFFGEAHIGTARAILLRHWETDGRDENGRLFDMPEFW